MREAFQLLTHYISLTISFWNYGNAGSRFRTTGVIAYKKGVTYIQAGTPIFFNEINFVQYIDGIVMKFNHIVGGFA